MKEKLRRLGIWWRAHTTSLPYWRVTYSNGDQTYRIPKSEAVGLSEVFEGTMWIDYDVPY